MSTRASRASITWAIVWKDLRDFACDRLWMVLKPSSLVFVVVLFWILPRTADETITVGVAPPELAVVLEAIGESRETGARGLDVVAFDDEDQLAAAVSGELKGQEPTDVSIGIAFPEGFVAAVMAGERTTVSVYLDAAVPNEIGRPCPVRFAKSAMDCRRRRSG